jgi:hypothetical protein
MTTPWNRFNDTDVAYTVRAVELVLGFREPLLIHAEFQLADDKPPAMRLVGHECSVACSTVNVYPKMRAYADNGNSENAGLDDICIVAYDDAVYMTSRT